MQHKGPPIFKAWVIFVLLSTILGFLAGAIVGFVIGFALGAAGHDVETIQTVCTIAGFMAGLPVSFLVFQRVVNRFIVPNVWPPPQENPHVLPSSASSAPLR